MRTVVVLFTRDLRIHDHPALELACRTADRVVPLFVHDPALKVPPARARFLNECLADLRGDLLIRQGDPVAETVRATREFDAVGVTLSADVSAYATSRQRRLESGRLKVIPMPGVTVVPAAEVVPTTGGDHYKVFTPYYRAWQMRRWRTSAATPEHLTVPDGLSDPDGAIGNGGETAALRRLEQWRKLSNGYNDLAGDTTSRLSAYLHFGCLSPLRLATSGMPDTFIRQLCWRDFYHQILAAFPKLASAAFRPTAAEGWDTDEQALQAWQTGNTGVDIVDAGMRQLLAEGWMHNRARLITASYLTKTMGLDWRSGAGWFMRHARQAERFDPHGNYVKRWIATK